MLLIIVQLGRILGYMCQKVDEEIPGRDPPSRPNKKMLSLKTTIEKNMIEESLKSPIDGNRTGEV